MRLIDADHLKKWIINRGLQYPLKTTDILDQIDRELTYKVMVDIVRCKDCKYRMSNYNCYVSNFKGGLPCMIRWVNDDDFCSYAERKKDE